MLSRRLRQSCTILYGLRLNLPFIHVEIGVRLRRNMMVWALSVPKSTSTVLMSKWVVAAMLSGSSNHQLFLYHPINVTQHFFYLHWKLKCVGVGVLLKISVIMMALAFGTMRLKFEVHFPSFWLYFMQLDEHVLQRGLWWRNTFLGDKLSISIHILVRRSLFGIGHAS